MLLQGTNRSPDISLVSQQQQQQCPGGQPYIQTAASAVFMPPQALPRPMPTIQSMIQQDAAVNQRITDIMLQRTNYNSCNISSNTHEGTTHSPVSANAQSLNLVTSHMDLSPLHPERLISHASPIYARLVTPPRVKNRITYHPVEGAAGRVSTACRSIVDL